MVGHDTLNHLSVKKGKNGSIQIETTTELTLTGAIKLESKTYTVTSINKVENGRTVAGKMCPVYQATCHLNKEAKKSEQTKQS
ncbi:MAG: hypothetical protein KAJ19_27655 [Gammaproteobacteria bacterium]|nr:hypothetical protein [Gammaproteobacteria bacterium]